MADTATRDRAERWLIYDADVFTPLVDAWLDARRALAEAGWPAEGPIRTEYERLCAEQYRAQLTMSDMYAENHSEALRKWNAKV